MSETSDPRERLRTETREGAEELAECEGTIGAMARIALALADGDDPDPEDCKEAGLDVIHDLGHRGDRP